MTAVTSPVLLTTLQPGRRAYRLALGAVIVFLAIFLAIAPFATIQLSAVPSFIPLIASALIINDLMTAVLLFGQLQIQRTGALLILACAYLFTALMTTAHLLSFPGAFSATGLLGAGVQTTAWLYVMWHGVFPLCVIGYTLSTGRAQRSALSTRAIWLGVAGAVLAALALILLCTAGEHLLPVMMNGNRVLPAGQLILASAWGLSIVALTILWLREPHSMLDLSLMVVLCVWVFDIGLGAVLNGGRYDLGYYAGRLFGLLATTLVLVVLLLENARLHGALLAAHLREIGTNADLRRLGGELEDANQELAEKNMQLEHASQMKTEFLANMSHELRTPLNAIIGFSEVLKDGLMGPLAPNQKEYANDIYCSGHHLLSLINDILDLSKVEAGKMTLEFEAIRIDMLVQSGLQVVREKATALRVHLVAEVDEQLPTILLDGRKAKQILFNLLSNAVKFTNEGGVVRVCARRVGPESVPGGNACHYLEIKVSDTGIGIAPEDQFRLFQPFTQIDSTLARRHEGSGLGLAMVKRLTELHGGTLSLHSVQGEGSTFTVWLPWRAADLPPVAGQRTSLAWPQHGGRPLALIVEDNEKAASLLQLQLEDAGYRIARADSAEMAFELAARECPALVTLDILLPGMDGWAFLERFKGDARFASVPVVIVSIVADRQRGMALGACHVLQKPVTRDDMASALAAFGFATGKSARAWTVLVVDDDPKALQLTAGYLVSAGYKVVQASGGQQAIDAARQERPDLIVLDLVMPGVSGFDVIDALKQDSATASVPVFILTGSRISDSDRARLDRDVLNVMEKSQFDQQRFIDDVQQAMAMKGT